MSLQSDLENMISALDAYADFFVANGLLHHKKYTDDLIVRGDILYRWLDEGVPVFVDNSRYDKNGYATDGVARKKLVGPVGYPAGVEVENIYLPVIVLTLEPGTQAFLVSDGESLFARDLRLSKKSGVRPLTNVHIGEGQIGDVLKKKYAIDFQEFLQAID